MTAPPNQKPSIAIASDHAGFDQKAPLIQWLKEQGYEVSDLGPSTDERVDYPDYALLVCEAIIQHKADLGVLICGTGIGMSIAANKVNGIRAANLTSEEFAALAREHNHANVAALSSRYVDIETNKRILTVFLTTDPLGERHAERVAKITAMEARNNTELG